MAPYGPTVSQETKDAVEQARADLAAGTKVVFAGPIVDQDGNVKVAEGEVLTRGRDGLGRLARQGCGRQPQVALRRTRLGHRQACCLPMTPPGGSMRRDRGRRALPPPEWDPWRAGSWPPAGRDDPGESLKCRLSARCRRRAAVAGARGCAHAPSRHPGGRATAACRGGFDVSGHRRQARARIRRGDRREPGPGLGTGALDSGRLDPSRPPRNDIHAAPWPGSCRGPALAGRLRGVPARAHRVCPRRSALRVGRRERSPVLARCLAVRLRDRTSVPSAGWCSDPGTRGGTGGPGRGPDPVGGRLPGRRLLRPGGAATRWRATPRMRSERAGIVPGVREAAHQSDQLRVARRPCGRSQLRASASSRSRRSWGRIARGDPSSVIRARSCRALHWLGPADRDVDGMGTRPQGGACRPIAATWHTTVAAAP